MKTFRYNERNANGGKEYRDVKKKVHAIAREVLQYGVGDSVLAGSGGRREAGCNSKKFSRNESTERNETLERKAHRSLDKWPSALLCRALS